MRVGPTDATPIVSLTMSAAARHERGDTPKLVHEHPISTGIKQSPPPYQRRSSSSSKPPSVDSPPRVKAASAPPVPPPALEKDVKLPPVSEVKPRSRSTASTPTAEQPPDPPKKPEPAVINMDTFGQILEMDDDEDVREFSKSIVYNFFEQASATLRDIDKSIADKNFKVISELGHFLKGSSGALGIDRVQRCCERMQHYGKFRDEEKDVALTETEAFDMIVPLNTELKSEYQKAEEWLRDFFGD